MAVCGSLLSVETYNLSTSIASLNLASSSCKNVSSVVGYCINFASISSFDFKCSAANYKTSSDFALS